MTLAPRRWYRGGIRTGEAPRRTGTGVPHGWWPEFGLLVAFATLTAALAASPADGPLLGLDLAVRDWALAHRWEPAWLASRAVNQIGSANLLGAICLVIAIIVGRSRRSAWPLLPVVAAFALSYLLIGPVKLLSDRAAPRAPAANSVELFADPDGWSYPSGHVVNTFIWFYAIVLLLEAWLPGRISDRMRRWLRVAPPVAVSCTVTYLAFHWFTDVLAAIALGLLLERIMSRVRWPAPLRDPVSPR